MEQYPSITEVERALSLRSASPQGLPFRHSAIAYTLPFFYASSII